MRKRARKNELGETERERERERETEKERDRETERKVPTQHETLSRHFVSFLSKKAFASFEI